MTIGGYRHPTVLAQIARRLPWTMRRALFVLPVPELLAALVRRAASPRGVPVAESGGGWDNHPFDVCHGTETGDYIHAKDLRSGRESDLFITGYSACHAGLVRQIIRAIPFGQETVFVDLGCGKGRAAIVASEFPFSKIVGLEIAPALAAIARRNVDIVRARFPSRPEIQILEGDAAALQVPAGDVVLFLYNPFHKRLIRAVLDILEAAVAAERSRLYVAYCNPVWRGAFDHSPWFRRHYTATLRCEPAEIGFAPEPFDDVIVWESVAPERIRSG